MKIIGVTGVKGSGKNTTYELLKKHNPDIKEISLAGKLKQACKDVLGLTEEQITDRELKEAPLYDPIYLDANKIVELFEAFGEGDNIDYDKHVRPHVGMTLDSPRRTLQYVGTEVLRSIRDNIHSFYLYSQIKGEEGTYFITDLRFFDEYEFFAKKFEDDFQAWYISNSKAEAAGEGDMHPSEQGIFQIKPKALQIENNGTLLDFENTLLGIYNGSN